MLNHYEYFIALAEEQNISKAAERLFISHQCLSRYLINLEKTYQIALFERKPAFRLTEAGRVYLDMLRQVQLLEKNTEDRFADIRHLQEGRIRFATTEGRYRVLIPKLISRYQELYPDVKLETYCATTGELYERLESNQFDLVLLNYRDRNAARFETQTLLRETMYLVASDGLLAKYFPEMYPECLDTLRKGVDLGEFAKRGIPFVQTPAGFNSRDAVDELCRRRGISLNVVSEMSQPDIHFLLCATSDVASFCYSMYLPHVQTIGSIEGNDRLNTFPVKGLKAVNDVVLAMPKGKVLPSYGKGLVRLLKSICKEFEKGSKASQPR